MGQDDVEGRPAAGAAALDQRRMEPAPVLVRALEIHHRVGPALEPAARLEVVADLEREGVRRARVEPDVEHHPDLLVGGRIVAEGLEEARRRVGRKPGVRPLRLEGGGDRLVDALVLEDAVGAALDEDRDRRAPGALARDHPVGLRLDHAGDPVLPLRRHPLHRLDRGKRAMAQRIPLAGDRLVHGDEPLRRVAEDQRRLRAPGMRVLMLEAPAGEERAGLDELRDDGLVRAGVLALVVVDARAGEQRHAGQIRGILADRVRHLRRAAGREGLLVLDEGVVVVRAVAWRRVHEAGAGVVGDVVGREHRHVEIPEAVRAGKRPERVREAGDHRRQHLLDALIGGHPRRAEDLAGKLVGDDVALAGLRPIVGRRLGDAVEPVCDARPVGDGAVRRDRPRRRRPDQDRGAGKVAVEGVDDRELHDDGRRDLLVILDLGLGERGLLDRGPHHRLRAAIELVRHRKRHDLAGDLGLGRKVHGRVGAVPVALDAEALELLALHVHPARREGAAFAAELDDVDGVLVLAAGAVFLLDLPLDRQAVAVPARHVVRSRGRASAASARRGPS